MNENAKTQLREFIEGDRALRAVFGQGNRELSTLRLFGVYVHTEKRRHWRLPASSPDGRRGINSKTFLAWIDGNSEKFTGTEIEKAKRDMEILRLRHPLIGRNNILHQLAEKLDDAGVIEEYSNQNPYTITSAYREAMGFVPLEETPRVDAPPEDDRIAEAQKPIAKDKESEARGLPATALSGGVLNAPRTSVDEELDLEAEARIATEAKVDLGVEAEVNVEGTEVMPEGEPLSEEDIPTEEGPLAEERISGKIEETITAEEERVTDVPVGIGNLVTEVAEKREKAEINLSGKAPTGIAEEKRKFMYVNEGSRTKNPALLNRVVPTQKSQGKKGQSPQKKAELEKQKWRQQAQPSPYQGDRSGSVVGETRSNLAKKLAKIAGGVTAGGIGAGILGGMASASAMCLEILIK